MTDLIRPVPGAITQTFAGTFSGERSGYLNTAQSPYRGKRSPFPGGAFHAHLHLAIDYNAPHGTPIHAMAAGKLVRQGISSPDGATYIEQRVHVGPNFVFYVLYYHLVAKSFKFATGTVVGQGQVIGLADSTGWSTGDHLHVDLVRMPRGMSPDLWYGQLHLDPQPFIDGHAHFVNLD